VHIFLFETSVPCHDRKSSGSISILQHLFIRNLACISVFSLNCMVEGSTRGLVPSPRSGLGLATVDDNLFLFGGQFEDGE
jgi:hypothetical protein